MKNAIRKTYKNEIRKILIFNGLLPILISSLLIYGFIMVYSNYYIEEKNLEANHKATNVLNTELELYMTMSDRFSEIEKVKIYFESGTNKVEIYELLYGFSNNRKIRSMFYVTDVNGYTLLTNAYPNAPYNRKGVFYSGIFKRMKDDPESIAMGLNKIQLDINKRTLYSVGKAIIIDEKVQGYILFDLLEIDLSNIIDEGAVDLMVVVDRFNNAVVSSNNLVLNDLGKFQPKIEKDRYTYLFNNEKFNIQFSEIIDGDLRIYSLESTTFIRQLFLVNGLINISILIIVIILVIIASKRISKSKTDSIDVLIKAIQKVQNGDLDTKVHIQTNDEFSLIGNYFNGMLDKFKTLLSNNEELTIRKSMAEIKQLEAQFNPHFLFNTLETLKSMIRIDSEKAVVMLVSLSKLLRYSIDYKLENVALEEDIKYIKDYLRIQKFRFNKRLNYSIDIDDLAKDCIVPKLIIQPIIENAINHGYGEKDNLTIDLCAKIENNQLKLIINDNGDGISEKVLFEINSIMNDESPESSHIGINNIHKRIRLLYGSNYGLNIKSKEREGTLVTILMPVMK